MTLILNCLGIVVRDSFADQFLTSPLLILTAAIVIALISVAYHKIRK